LTRDPLASKFLSTFESSPSSLSYSLTQPSAYSMPSPEAKSL
jgi:hypothetical protein